MELRYSRGNIEGWGGRVTSKNEVQGVLHRWDSTNVCSGA